MLVFIIDDEPQQRAGMDSLIKGKYKDAEVYSFRNGADALTAMQQKPADIIFSDIRMPHISGLELAERVHEIQPDTIVILISAYTEFEYARKAIDIGVFTYLLKPINPAEVFQVYEKAVSVISSRKKQNRIDEREISDSMQFESPDRAMDYAIKYIKEHYQSRISIDNVAKLCHYSTSHFSNLFKTKTGMTFIAYLNHFRIEKSTALLINTDKKISDVASLVGLDDVKYYVRLFLREYGMTPKSYRKLTQD